MPGESAYFIDEGPRSKRKAIIDAAVRQFGSIGFENTKWSHIADEVGLGQTALYHYFESKTHCLFVVMQIELQRSYDHFIEATHDEPDPTRALSKATWSIFDLTPEQTLQLRTLQNYQHMLARSRKLKGEEQARLECLSLLEANYNAWQALIKAGTASGTFHVHDSNLMTRAILAQVISVWQWYRIGGPITLEQIRTFTRECIMRMVGAEE